MSMDSASDNSGQAIFQSVLQGTQKFLEGTEARQTLIRDIERITGRRLLVYHGSFVHQDGAVTGTDLHMMVDLTQSLPPRPGPVDLLLYTPGGDANAAELILNLLHQRSSSLRVLVPRSAKSAGTLIALGSREIVMGVASELGPVDPQIPIAVGGLVRFVPAQAFLDSQEELLNRIGIAQANGQQLAGFANLLQTISVPFVNEAGRQIQHAKQMGKRWLTRSMYPGDEDAAERIMDALTAANINYSHGRMIDAKMAKELGLRVRNLPPANALWRALWRLHLLNEVFMTQAIPAPVRRVKLCESATVSLTWLGPAA